MGKKLCKIEPKHLKSLKKVKYGPSILYTNRKRCYPGPLGG